MNIIITIPWTLIYQGGDGKEEKKNYFFLFILWQHNSTNVLCIVVHMDSLGLVFFWNGEHLTPKGTIPKLDLNSNGRLVKNDETEHAS